MLTRLQRLCEVAGQISSDGRDRFDDEVFETAQLLYQMPCPLTLDAAALGALDDLADTSPDSYVRVSVRPLALLAAWHLEFAHAELLDRASAWLRELEDVTLTWTVEHQAREMTEAARSAYAVCVLLGLTDADPACGSRILARAAKACRLLPDGELNALILAESALAWLRSAGDSPDADLEQIVEQCARSVEGALGRLPQRPALFRLLAAWESLDAPVPAQFARLFLAELLAREGVVRSVPGLLEVLESGPQVLPDQMLRIQAVRAQVLALTGGFATAEQVVEDMAAAVPAQHPAMLQLGVFRASLAAAQQDWVGANAAMLAPASYVLALAVPPEPLAAEYVGLLAGAGGYAQRAGDRVRATVIRQRLDLYAAVPGGVAAAAMMDAWDAAERGDWEAAADRAHVAADTAAAALRDVRALPGDEPIDRLRTQGLSATSCVLDALLTDIELRRGQPWEAVVATESRRADFLLAALDVGLASGTTAGLAGFLDAALRRLDAGSQGADARILSANAIDELRGEPLHALLRTPATPNRNVAADVAGLVAGLGDEWLLASLNTTSEALTLVCTDGSRTVGRRVPLSGESWIAELRALFSRMVSTGPAPASAEWSKRAERCLQDLAPVIGKPLCELAEQLGRGRIALSAPGLVGGVPLGAIEFGDGGRLIDRLDALSVIPGFGFAASSARREDRRNSGPACGGAVGGRRSVVVAAVDDDSIELARVEAEVIRDLWRSGSADVETVVPFDQEQLVASAGRARVLHVAGHASWNPMHTLASGLRFDGGVIDAGELLAALDVAGVDVVVLSACDTAASTLGPAGEALNLAQLVSIAGARQVVASLWPVEDAATFFVMAELHAGLAGGADAASALWAAQRTVRGLTCAQTVDRLDAWSESTPGLEDLRALYRLQPSDAHPFARMSHWAPFACFGTRA